MGARRTAGWDGGGMFLSQRTRRASAKDAKEGIVHRGLGGVRPRCGKRDPVLRLKSGKAQDDAGVFRAMLRPSFAIASRTG